jgi:glycosyltransferase involved in cell wall biosynthesis
MTAAAGKLYVDCQVFQHSAWSRGMGRYTLKLLAALDAQHISLVLLLNSELEIHKDRLDAIRADCPNAEIRYVNLPTNPDIDGGWLELQRRCSVELDKQLGAALTASDTYLIASNFALGYCSVFPNLTCNKALIFYDLTPYLQWKSFGHTPDFEPNKYFAQLETVFKADQLWAISHSAAEEARLWLGIDSGKIHNIRGASIRNMAEPDKRPKSVSDRKKFLLSPSSDSPHKNNERMVRAFAAFNARHDDSYSLVITSNFTEQSRAQLGQISDDVIFCGHVSDGELGWLYQHCEGLLFVSTTEGLGLPILEAVAADKKVICSDIPVFKEISDQAFYFADPADEQSIAGALEEALAQAAGWPVKQAAYAEINAMYDWSAVARDCVCLATASPTRDTASERDGKSLLYYPDPDGPSNARDVAEVWCGADASVYPIAARAAAYGHAAPSYLVEMGKAERLTADVTTSTAHPIYLVDDSKESGLLLLRAVVSPGVVISRFKQTAVPGKLEQYSQSVFGADMTYGQLVGLLKLAGNDIRYCPPGAKRGSQRFLDEVRAVRDETVSIQEKK